MDRIGKYQIQAQIGRGGFGRVYRAFDPTVGRTVAIKVMLGDGGELDSELLGRFRIEASATGGLRHKNIITVFDYGEHEGMPYLVIEYLEGRDLQKVMSEGQPLSLLEKVTIMEQVAEGLEHAHHNDVVHRDVKPANIMILKDGSVKIMDFGIARVLREQGTRITQQGNIIGTVAYMAPEQFWVGETDHRSDIFAYGVIFYELITGLHPFRTPKSENVKIMYNIGTVHPPPVSSLVPECPPELNKLIVQAMEKDRELRYQSFEDVRFDVAPIQRELKRRFVEEKMVAAQEAFDSGRLDEAQAIVREVLTHDPSNVNGRWMREEIQKTSRNKNVRERVNQLAAAAKQHLSEGDLPKAIEHLEGALKLDSANTALKPLLEKARAELAKANRIAVLLETARRQLDAQNLSGAHRLITECLNEAPGHDQAAALLVIVRERMERRDREQRIEETLGRAKNLAVGGSYTEALALLDELVANFPDATHVKGIAERLRARQQQEIQRRLASEIGMVKGLIHTRQWEPALNSLERLTGEHPSHAELSLLLTQVRDELRAQRKADEIERITREAQRLGQAEAFDQASAVLDKGLQKYPADKDLEQAARWIAEERTRYVRDRAIQGAARRAGELRNSKQYREALAELDGVIERWNSTDLSGFRNLIDAEWKAEQRIAALASVQRSVEEFGSQGRWTEAVQATQDALRLYPGDLGLADLLAKSQDSLQRQTRTRKEDEIESLIAGQQFAEAIGLADAAIREQPAHGKFAQLKGKAEQARFRQQREQACEAALTESRQLRSAGDLDNAIRVLERLDAVYERQEMVTALLDELTAEKAEQRRRQAEQEARERAEREAQERARQEKLAQEQAARAREAQERAAREAEALERARKEKLAQEQAAREREAQERAAREAEALERARKEKLAQEQAARAREAQERAAREAEALERARQEKLAQEQAARAREAQERAVREAEALERARKEKLAQEQAAREREAQEHAAREAEALERARKEKLAQEQAARAREAQERAVREAEALERARQEKLAQEQAARAREAQERAAREAEALERARQEKLAQEQAAREREAQERAAREAEALERARQEKLAQEQAAREREAQAHAAREADALERTRQEKLAQEQAARAREAQERAVREAEALERARQEKLAQEQAAREREAQERAAREAEALERVRQEKLAQEQAAREREAQAHAAREAEALERTRQEKLAQEQAAREREAQERAAREAEALERARQEKRAQEQAAREREAQEHAAREAEALERARQEKLAQEQAAREREAQERAAREAEALERARQEKLAQEQAAREREAQERAAREAEALERARQEKLAQEQAAREREAKEHAAREAETLERARQEKLAQEQAARAREAQERAAREAEALERARKEKLAQEKAAREREAQERARKQKEAEEQAAREREAQERAAREAEERARKQKAAEERAAEQKAERERQERIRWERIQQILANIDAQADRADLDGAAATVKIALREFAGERTLLEKKDWIQQQRKQRKPAALPAPPSETPPAQIQPVPPPKKNVWMLGGMAVAALAAIGIYFAFRGGSGSGTSLLVRVAPTGASVVVNGQTCHESECRFALAKGSYEVEARLEGYRPVRLPITIGDSTPSPLRVTLEPYLARLRVSTNLEAGVVTLDGRPRGALVQGELAIENSPAGKHTIEVSAPGGARARLQFETEPGRLPLILAPVETTDLQALAWARLGANASVVGDGKVRTVALDDRKAGELGPKPISVGNLSEGTHELRIEDGSRTLRFPVAPQIEPSVTLFARVDRDAGFLLVDAHEPDVAVLANGKLMGKTGPNGIFQVPLPAAAYSVTAEKPGFKPAPLQRVRIARDAVQQLALRLEPNPAELSIADAAAGTQVFADRRLLGAVGGASATFALPAGPHDIELRRDGYTSKQFAMRFDPGGRALISGRDAQLSRIAEPKSVKPEPPPNNVQVQSAEARRMEQLQGSRDLAALEQFRREFPQSTQLDVVSRRIELIEWETARARKESGAIEAFLAKYPRTAYRDEAASLLAQLDKERLDRQKVESARLELATREKADAQSVLQTLTQLSAAYGSKDGNEISRLYPAVSKQLLNSLRKDIQSLSVQLRPAAAPQVVGDTATVQVDRSVATLFKGENKPRTESDRVTISFRRSGGAWVVDSIR